MDTGQLLVMLLRFALFIPAIVLHEVAHGYVAYLLGDPTAHDQGRLTLNPLSHVDLWGSVLMPAILLVSSGFAFGYAKPVPVNPYLMRKTTVQTGMLLTGIAGPATNVALAIVSGILFRILTLFPGAPEIVLVVILYFAQINLVLAFFNLIPIPPLDGSRVVQRFLSGRALEFYESIEPYGFLIVLGLIFLLPRFTGIDPLDTYFAVTVGPVLALLTGVGL